MKKPQSLSHLWAARWAINSSFSWKKCCFPRLFCRFLETNCPSIISWTGVHARTCRWSRVHKQNMCVHNLSHADRLRGGRSFVAGGILIDTCWIAQTSLSRLSERVSESTCDSFVLLPIEGDAACRIYGVALDAEVTIAFTPTARRWKKKGAEFSPLYDFQPRFRRLPCLRPTPHFQEQIIVI